MHDICVLGAADVRPHRTGVPAVHLLDDQADTMHLGVIEDGGVVGVVSGFVLHPTGARDPHWMQLYGPFGAHREALVEALVARADDGTTLWSDAPVAGFESDGQGRHLYWTPALEYGVDSIRVLEGLEAVRMRPGMYVGSVGAPGVQAVLLEAVGNVVDEHLGGHASTLWVDRQPDGTWTVADDGRGLSPEMVEVAFTTLHGGAHLGGPRRHVHLGLHGLGLSVLNALSDLTVVTVERDGTMWEQLYRRGLAVTPLLRVGSSLRTGTTIRFRPDREIFTEAPGIEEMLPILERVAMLNPRLKVVVGGVNHSVPGGLLSRARELASGPVVDHLVVEGRHDDVEVRLAVVWSARDDALRVEMFANQLLVEAGTPVEAVRALLGPGATVVGDVGLYEPRYAGRTKSEVTNAQAGTAVRALLAPALAARR